VAFAFQGASATSEYALPLQLLQSVMGAWDRRSGIGADGAARWTIALGEHDIAHTAAPFSLNYKDTGLFGVYGVCPDISLDNFMWFTLENLVRMCHKTTDEEVRQ
jgi:mitochondrial-processing peptidase subunit beta